MAKKPKLPEDCMPKCRTCAFYEAVPGDVAGYCRRFPPVGVPDADGNAFSFPVVEAEDWCGEYSRRLQA